MLKELKKEDWLTLLKIPPDLVPTTLVLRGTRNLQHHYRRYAAYCSEIIELGSSTGFLEDVFIGKVQGHIIAYASVYGGSMASEIVHIFGEVGTKSVLQTGCCGGINQNLRMGELVVAERAFSGEGVAPYYSAQNEFVGDLIDIDALRGLSADVTITPARIFTTAALMAEGRQEVNEWQLRGFDAVDMETAAVFAVAEYFDMRRGSLLFISDLPYTDQGLLHNVENDRVLDECDDMMVDVALKYIQRNGASSRTTVEMATERKNT